ncbi:MAG: transposase, partial [Candidatus Fervidibacter sp.]|uniref:transposase n=1 Tax=Candidatus Fervidibacter sp. TaxID=3100871 RepID=UPI00404987CF
MRALCTKSESFTRLLDEEECYQQVRRLRWPDGKVRCPCCPGCAPYHNMSE